MTTRLVVQDVLESDSSYALIVARTAELEHLNATLRAAFGAASRNSDEFADECLSKTRFLRLVAHELRGPLPRPSLGMPASSSTNAMRWRPPASS